jgi:S-adenosylmethionine:tRNA ribosyltransferase-isomerase
VGRELKVDALDYRLPERLIAQVPPDRRTDARLMAVHRRTGAVAHFGFPAIVRLLAPGDLLVLNDTKVIRGRLRARKPTGGAVEILLLSPLDGPDSGGRWDVLARPSGRLREGMAFRAGGEITVTLVRRLGDGRWEAALSAPGPIWETLDRVGLVPLPPYIRRQPGGPGTAQDAQRYQTVFAVRPGSVAAPTAGLHFDRPLLDAVRERGVSIAFVTLAVGYGTFAPIRTVDVASHAVHSEWYHLGTEAAAAVDAARRRGGRVVAVGTTCVRVLETCAAPGGRVVAQAGRTQLFVRPGYVFRVVDAMVTNFHLPRTSLLALVMAFGGMGRIRKAYRRAVEAGYRFASYGDAMFIGDTPALIGDVGKACPPSF